MPAEDLKGPKGDIPATGESFITAVAAADAAAHVVDLSDANHFAGTSYQSRFCRIICDQNLFYFWTNNPAAVADKTAVDGTNRGRQTDELIANVPREEIPTGRYLAYQAAAAGTIRVSVVDRLPAI